MIPGRRTWKVLQKSILNDPSSAEVIFVRGRNCMKIISRGLFGGDYLILLSSQSDLEL